MSMSLKVWWAGKAQCVVPSCKVWHFYYVYCVWENPNVNVFDKHSHLTDQKHVNYLLWTHTRVAQFILCTVYLMYVATIPHLSYSRQESKQESKKHSLHFWHTCDLETKSLSGNLKWNCRPRTRFNHAKFEWSPFNSAPPPPPKKKKATLKFLIKRGNMSIISL